MLLGIQRAMTKSYPVSASNWTIYIFQDNYRKLLVLYSNRLWSGIYDHVFLLLEVTNRVLGGKIIQGLHDTDVSETMSKRSVIFVLLQKCRQLSWSMGSSSFRLKIARAVDAGTGRWFHGDSRVRQDLLLTQPQHHACIITFFPRATL